MIHTLFAFLLLACSVAASTCPVNLPLPSAVAGRALSMMTPCGPARFVAYGTVSVSNTEIRYTPFQEDFNHGNVNPGYVCKRQFIFRMERWAPLLTELPRLVIPSDVDRNSNYCEREQARQRILSRPNGPTRDKFIAGMNATISGITYLRDHECRSASLPAPPLPFRYHEEHLNGWLNAPLAYLLSVAYNVGLCLNV
ncbi:hypothetical protein FGB62_10g24 [Gracilaria domingensis]|nr:hypothetical protein FGB62_10g24 [Gracilaria domingensis]